MFSPLLDTLMQYGGAVVVGIATGLLFKMYFAGQIQGKIKEYQCNIVKSHSKILELEAKNEALEKRIREAEGIFSKDKIFMN